ncbi:MAG: hypothetical protein ACT4QE_06550 [Anaerolineales bacterium]
MQDIVDKFVSNLVVAAFIPSFIFATILYLMLDPILPPGIMTRLNTLATQPGWLVLFGSLGLSFTLLYLSELIYWFYSAGFLPRNFPFNLERSRAERLQREIETTKQKLTTRLQELEQQQRAEFDEPYWVYSYDKLLEDYENKFYGLTTIYQRTFPASLDLVSHTRFGNILNAALSYPAMRYGIDPTVIWPRLRNIMPEKNYAILEEAKRPMSLLLYSSFLMSVLAIIGLLLSTYQNYIYVLAQSNNPAPLYFLNISLTSEVYLQRTYIYLFASIGLLLVSWVTYKMSLPFASQFCVAYCSTFDLYRFELLKQLKVALPANLAKEQDLWNKLCEHIGLGEARGPLSIEYETEFPLGETAATAKAND